MNPYAPPAALAPVLRPAAWIYGLATAWRNRRYAAGDRPTDQLAHPVLAVGNLTVGGTGKTPVVAHLAAELQRRGWRPAILSRGYRRQGEHGETVAVVSDGTTIFLGPGDAGDEPVLLARRLPGVPVLCHRHRGVAGRWAEANLVVNLFILDDGFQHRALHRDCNLLLLDGAEPLGNGRLLPAGPLREHPRGMRRAGGNPVASSWRFRAKSGADACLSSGVSYQIRSCRRGRWSHGRPMPTADRAAARTARPRPPARHGRLARRCGRAP